MQQMDYWRGDKIVLRAVEPEDAPIFFDWNRDLEMTRSVDWVWPPGSLAAQRQWAASETQRKSDKDEYFLVIENRAGDLVGCMNTHHCDRRTGCFSYGVAIRREHRQQGYASEAIRRIQAYFFWELRYQKVTVDVYSFNQPSIVLHQRLGFEQEGRLRRLLFTGSEHHDILIFGQTREEFEEVVGREA